MWKPVERPFLARRKIFATFSRQAPRLFIAGLVTLASASTGCERLVSDSATRIAYQRRDGAVALQKSGALTRTFEHRPAEWPNGIEGDYRIELVSSTRPGEEKRAIATAKSFDGPNWSHTTYHLNFVQVQGDLIAAPRKGEPAVFTLELRDGKVILTGLR